MPTIWYHWYKCIIDYSRACNSMVHITASFILPRPGPDAVHPVLLHRAPKFGGPLESTSRPTSKKKIRANYRVLKKNWKLKSCVSSSSQRSLHFSSLRLRLLPTRTNHESCKSSVPTSLSLLLLSLSLSQVPDSQVFSPILNLAFLLHYTSLSLSSLNSQVLNCTSLFFLRESKHKTKEKINKVATPLGLLILM